MTLITLTCWFQISSTTKKFGAIVRVVVVVGRGVFTSENFHFKWSFDFVFEMSLAIEDMISIFYYQHDNIRDRRSKMDPKIDTLGQFDTRDFVILG